MCLDKLRFLCVALFSVFVFGSFETLQAPFIPFAESVNKRMPNRATHGRDRAGDVVLIERNGVFDAKGFYYYVTQPRPPIIATVKLKI